MNGVAPVHWQPALAASLLDPAVALPAGLRVRAGADPLRRLAVHRNNVVVSLVAALAETFPVVRRLVGGSFFDAMAAAFVRAQPPRSPVLADYGDGFAGWLESFAPVAALPWLADVARLERARVQAFHAADARALDAAAIGGYLADAAALPRARPVLHPSCRVVVSAYAVATIWSAHQAASDDDVLPFVVDRPESALVLRDSADVVLVIPLAPAAGAFCAVLAAGAALGDAAAAALEVAGAADPSDRLDLAGTLALLIRHRALVAWPAPSEPR